MKVLLILLSLFTVITCSNHHTLNRIERRRQRIESNNGYLVSRMANLAAYQFSDSSTSNCPNTSRYPSSPSRGRQNTELFYNSRTPFTSLAASSDDGDESPETPELKSFDLNDLSNNDRFLHMDNAQDYSQIRITDSLDKLLRRQSSNRRY